MKWQRAISLATLAISIFTLFLVLRRPAPVGAPPASPAAAAANVRSFEDKVSQLDQPRTGGEPAPEVRINSAELEAAMSQATGMINTAATSSSTAGGAAASSSSSGSGASPGASPAGASGSSMELPGPVPDFKDYQVSMDGDVVRGQFLTQIAGKDVYLTLAGHLGAKDGYATFDATEAKIGDLSVPVALVNQALQKKLAEQRDQLKLPDNVKDIRVENGQLVLVQK